VRIFQADFTSLKLSVPFLTPLCTYIYRESMRIPPRLAKTTVDSCLRERPRVRSSGRNSLSTPRTEREELFNVFQYTGPTGRSPSNIVF